MDSQDVDRQDFFPAVLRDIPEFRPYLEEHIANNDKLLDTLLIDDFYLFFADAYRRSVSSESNADRWRQIIAQSVNLLDRWLASPHYEVQELPLLFLENLNPGEEEYAGIKRALVHGAHLRNALNLYYANYP